MHTIHFGTFLKLTKALINRYFSKVFGYYSCVTILTVKIFMNAVLEKDSCSRS